jgi:hypothetical protein
MRREIVVLSGDLAASHRAGDPDAEGPAPRRGVRQGHLSAAEHHRTRRGLVQVVPGLGDALRQTGCQLSRSVDHREYPIPPAEVSSSSRSSIVRNDLAPGGSGGVKWSGTTPQDRAKRRGPLPGASGSPPPSYCVGRCTPLGGGHQPWVDHSPQSGPGRPARRGMERDHDLSSGSRSG